MDENVIAVDLSDEVILILAMQAHELDITLNQHMVNIIRAKCDEVLGE